MNKKEFTKKELYETIKYVIYCHFFEVNPNEKYVRSDYERFWTIEELTKHTGDCINENSPCLKCQADWIEGDAKEAIKAIW